ncbi:unnamed protein product [Cyclocybe aegerita]|uniref:Uncharacterized protein n=1 Tax=Cyclocybe aegerita TaxID=1973307 RepID=A0A8S0VSS0_CYCAE|nr:unnamed protein product [Cyclocybe aegerita]
MSKEGKDSSTGTETVSLLGLFRFATKLEVFLNVLGFGAAIACGSATPFMSLIFGNLIESFVAIGQAQTGGSGAMDLQAIADDFRHTARLDALRLIYLGLGTFSAAFLCIALWSYTGTAISSRVRERYFRAVIHQDLSFYDDMTAGEVATRIEIDARLVQQGISEKFAFIASYTSSFITGISIAYSQSWRLSLALSSMLPCIVIAGAGMTIFGSKYSKYSMDALSKAGGTAQESLSTIRTVHAFGAERTLGAVYDAFLKRTCTFDIKFSQVIGVGMALFSMIVYSSYSLSFYFGTTLLLQGHGDAGTVVTVGLAILIGSFSFVIVGPNIEAVMHAREAAYRLYKVIDRVPLIDSESPSGDRPAQVEGGIVFRDVDFAYPSRPDVPVLQHLNLTFPASKTSALVGLSGSGKSTIVSLIERFYDVAGGAVLFDGVDIRTLNTKWLRAQIGVVAQDPVLFAATIRENVSLGLLGTVYEEAEEEKKVELAKQACMKAQAHDFISALPDGYETLVGDGGMRLSGGQRQRIAIARAIVSDPKILLLDEATSALDTQSEGIVQAALTEASQGRTTVVIAHRLSTVKDADIIYVMGSGTVLEKGSHHELISNSQSHYAQLVSAQQLDRGSQSPDSEHGGATENDTLEQDDSEDKLKEKFVDEASVQVFQQERVDASKVKPLGSFSLIREIVRLTPDTTGMYLWGTLFGALGGLVHPAFGIVYAKALRAFENSDRQILRTAGSQNALWLFLIAICSTLSLAIHNVLFGRAAMILVARLRSLSFKALLRRNVTFFDRDENNPGTLTANLVGGPEKIKGFTSMTLGAILQCISCCIGGAIIGLIFGWKLGLVGIACMPPIVATGFLRLHIVSAKEKASKEAHNHSAQVASEAVVAIRTVASLTCEDYMCSVYGRTLYEPVSVSQVLANGVSNAVFAFSLSAILFAVALVFWYGSRLVALGEYTTFQFYVSFMSTVFGSWNAANVFLSVPDISSAFDAAQDIVALIHASKEPASSKSSLEKAATIDGKLVLRNISFRYPSRPEALVLDDFNVEIPKGAYVAFVGPSGSGKSTIIQLIERFYDPSSGTLYVDDRPVLQYGVDEYRNNISLVSQDTRLYSGTVKFNIVLGSSLLPGEITDTQIREACRLANILEFIESLPMGFETQVGERGSQLSGGQKQRIAIARALIRNPKILLLDEATSALDANSELAVQKALNNAAMGRTTVAIAHRLSSIQHADCIYFIQHGKMCESGTHSQLLAKRGKYFSYAQLQQLGGQ